MVSLVDACGPQWSSMAKTDIISLPSGLEFNPYAGGG